MLMPEQKERNMARASFGEQQTLSNARPYTPSWFDQFKRRVESLPIPAWLFYVGLGSVFVAIEFFTQWHAGNLPFGTITLDHLLTIRQRS
jgi:hypothetical protein